MDEFRFYRDQLWTAPELLRMKTRPINGNQKADVYSFAIILQQIVFRAEPYFIDIDNSQCMGRCRNILSFISCNTRRYDGTNRPYGASIPTFTAFAQLLSLSAPLYSCLLHSPRLCRSRRLLGRIVWSLKSGLGSFKVTENGTTR